MFMLLSKRIIWKLYAYAAVTSYNKVLEISNLPKIKKFDCVGRGDLTFLFKSCEIDSSQGRLV